MTNDEIVAAIWPIYQRYVGNFNTKDVRSSFRAEVQAVLGPVGANQLLICDDTNNPPAVVAANGFEFDFFFERNGKSFRLTSSELIRAHRAGML